MSEASNSQAVALDEFGQDAKNRLAGTIEQYNGMVGQLKALDGDPQLLLETLRTTSDNEEIKQINSKIDQLNDALWKLESRRDEILQPEVERMRSDLAGQSQEIRDKADRMLKTVKAGQQYLKDLYGEAALEGLPDVASRSNRSTSSSGDGDGAKRIRGFDWTVDGTLQTSRDAKGVNRSNTAAAAKAIGVDTATLQEAFWNAAGSRDSAKYPARVEFEVSVGDKTHKVVATKLTEEETPQKKGDDAGADVPASVPNPAPANVPAATPAPTE